MKKNINSYYFWPKPKLSSIINLSYNKKRSDVEDILAKYFPSALPIVFSSGRSAIFFCLLYNKLNRNNIIEYFPYANECIISSISQISNPVPLNHVIKSDFKISYHHWGYPIKIKYHKNIIEDSADSLYIKNSNLFTGNGDFEIWSLPKILGTYSGGILWCRNVDDYNNIQKLLINYKSSLLSAYAKIFAHKSNFLLNLWRSQCFTNLVPTKMQINEMYKAVINWNYYIDKVSNNIETVSQITEDWVNVSNSRLPCVMPFKNKKNFLSNLIKIGLRDEIRMFDINFDEYNQNYCKVLPIPIHYQVKKTWLLKVIDIIS